MYFRSLEGWKIQSSWTMLDYFQMHQLGDKNKLLERLARNLSVHNLDFMRIQHQLNKNNLPKNGKKMKGLRKLGNNSQYYTWRDCSTLGGVKKLVWQHDAQGRLIEAIPGNKPQPHSLCPISCAYWNWRGNSMHYTILMASIFSNYRSNNLCRNLGEDGIGRAKITTYNHFSTSRNGYNNIHSCTIT
jgi:hypothetical protein